MTDEQAKRLEEIEAREKAATAGKWFVVGGADKSWVIFNNGIRVRGQALKAVNNPNGSDDLIDLDAEFIGHAKQDIPYLLALVREQEDELEKLRAEASIARERLGPAGWKLLEELNQLRAVAEAAESVIETEWNSNLVPIQDALTAWREGSTR